jgi:acyl-CoA thioesterase
MLTLESLLRSLTLERVDADRYQAPNADTGPGVVFGGQLLGQTIVAALTGLEGKTVKTVHTVFARGGSMDAPVDITVDRMHSGRAFASSSVTISQGERLCTRSIVLSTADEPDLIRHADPAPVVGTPDTATAMGHDSDAWEIRIVDGVDIADPDAVGSPDLQVWTRFGAAPDVPAIHQALLAFATDGFLIGTAMRPHPGVGQALAHTTLSTGVVSHTLTFHEPVDANGWLLLAHHSPYAGRGRSYGRADVFTEDGALVASFVQDNMIRPMPAGSAL